MAIHVKERTVMPPAATRRAIAKPFGLGVAELIAVALVTIFLVSTLVYYLTALKPKQSELSGLQKQLNDTKQAETVMIAKEQKPPDEHIDLGKAALASLEDFKTSRLKPLSVGRIALINDINALAKKHNVQLTSGIDMSLDRSETQNEDKKGARAKKTESLLGVFPNLKTRFTVAGEYAKLRAFISELEANKQFITIDSVNLLAIRDTQGEGRGRRRMTISGIGLSVDMTAYFYPQSGN